MNEMINAIGYKFVELDNLPELRPYLKNKCIALDLKGTILISPEGINIALSGLRENIESFKKFLDTTPKLEKIWLKESPADKKPFNRMLVRLKKEIIAFGVEGINPAKYTSRQLPPKVLKEWLDQGKEVILLDTRNDYEIKLGTFKDAVIMEDLKTFRNFPAQVAKLDPALKDKPVVSFCTGGVRCEKAGPYLETQGFKDVYQLEGGILNYFEECGGQYWNGDCFVFDHRVAVTPTLEKATAGLCFRCRNPLTVEEMQSPDYVIDVSCPHCVGRVKH